MLTMILARPLGAAVGAHGLLFLFSGLFKGLVGSPIDLTLLFGALTIAALALDRFDPLTAVSPVTIMLAALVAWLGVRLLPDVSAYGVRKFGEIIVLGLPALALGVHAARYREMEGGLAWLSLPATALLVWDGFGVTSDFASIGSGGYQLTGLLMAVIMLACAAQKRPVLLAVAVLGSAIAGSVAGFLFGLIGVAAVWIVQRDWRAAAHSIVAILALLVVYSLIAGPPVVVSRMVYKAVGVLVVLTGIDIDASGAFRPGEVLANLGANSAAQIVDGVASHHGNVSTASRLGLLQSAWEHAVACNFMGCGYGSLVYEGHPYPHNAAMEMLAEAGVPALLMLFAVYGFAGYAAARSTAPFVLGMVVFAALVSMTNGYFGNRVLLFALGLAAGVARGDRA